MDFPGTLAHEPAGPPTNIIGGYRPAPTESIGHSAILCQKSQRNTTDAGQAVSTLLRTKSNLWVDTGRASAYGHTKPQRDISGGYYPPPTESIGHGAMMSQISQRNTANAGEAVSTSLWTEKDRTTFKPFTASSTQSTTDKATHKCFNHGCNGREFAGLWNLRRHERERSGISRSTCSKCQVNFARKAARDKHIKTCTGKALECRNRGCSEKFPTKGLRTVHEVTCNFEKLKWSEIENEWRSYLAEG